MSSNGLKVVEKTTRFKSGDYAIARSNKINKVTKKVDLSLVEIVNYDRTFNAYKVLEPGGIEAWYNPDRLQYTDNDPIVTKSYYEILNLREQVSILEHKFDSYTNRSFLQRIKEFITGSK